MQKIREIAILSIVFLSALYSTNSYAVEETVTKTAIISLETVAGKTVEGLSVAGPYVGVAVQAYSIGQEIRRHNFPTEEERAYALEVGEKYAFMTAENEFQSCLVKNRSSAQRGPSGRPIVCEEIARMFIMLGGKNEVNRMTGVYNQIRI